MSTTPNRAVPPAAPSTTVPAASAAIVGEMKVKDMINSEKRSAYVVVIGEKQCRETSHQHKK